jgi:hypothetical protein
VNSVEIPKGDNRWAEVRRDLGRIVPDVDHHPRLLLRAHINAPDPDGRGTL